MTADLSPPPPTEADLETLRVVGVRGSRDYAVAPLARAVLYLLHRDQERETFQRNVDDYFMDLTQQVEALQSIAQGNLESGTPNPSFTTEPCNAGAAGGEGEARDWRAAYEAQGRHLAETNDEAAAIRSALERERAAHQALRDDLRQERDIIALGHIDGNPPTVAAICARLSRLLDPPAPDPATVDGR